MGRIRKSPPSNDRDCTLAEMFGECVSIHRSCWLHIVANHFHSEKKITISDAKVINERFKHTSPCFLGSFPCRKRSKRTASRLVIPKIRKKLDTQTFENYMEVVWKSFSEEKRMSFGYLDSLWFSSYRKASSRTKVLTWIKQKSIFSKDYVFVPVVIWRHWSLLIFVHFGDNLDSETRTPCILLLDSLEGADPRRLEPEIRKFVWDIYKTEGREEDKDVISRIPLLIPKVPQQRDDEECGSYVLYFINSFMQNAPENFNRKQGYPYFMRQDWFDHEKLEFFRQGLEKELFRKWPTTNECGAPVQKLRKKDGVILLDD